MLNLEVPISASASQRRRAFAGVANISVFMAWMGLALSLLGLFWSLGNASPAELIGWINSDTLYPVNVTTDIFQDGYSLSGWRFSIAPCWFPDLVTAGLFWIITRNPITATLLAGFVQLALIIGAFHLMRKAIGLGSASLQTVLLLAVSVWLTLYMAAHPGLGYPDLFRFFIPQSHIGGLIMSVYALALGLLLLSRAQKHSRISVAVAATYAGVCLLAGMSNLMFFPQMLAPLTAAIAFGVFFGVLTERKCWVPVAIGWPSAAAGAVLNRVLFHTTDVAAQSQISREAALTALDVFMRGAVDHLTEPLHIIAVLWIAVCVIIVVMPLRKLARQQAQKVGLPGRLLWVFCCCWIFSDLFSAGAVILGGSNGLVVLKDYIWTTHYLQSIFLIPLFGLPLLAAWLIPQNTPATIIRGIVLVGTLLVIAIPAFRLVGTPVPKSSISDYRPPLVQFLDDLASIHGVKYGLAGYWQARITTLLSKKGLRVYAVDPSLNPFLWVSNIQWYTEALNDHRKSPPFNFVVLDDPAFKIPFESTVQILGQPSEETRFQDTRVLIYSGQMAWDPVMSGIDTPLTQFSEQITSSIASLQAHPGETVRIPVLVRNPTSERWTSAGKYPVNLSYKWFESGRMLNVEGVRTFLPHQVRPGSEVFLEAQVVVPNEGTNLTLKLSLVQEGVAWFFTCGAASLDIPVRLN